MFSIDKLQEVWHSASKLHYGQQYGGKTEGEHLDYISHIGSVAFEIIATSYIETDMDVDLAVTCAILHDSFEDTILSYDDVLITFGPLVADGILALTKNESLHSKHEMMLDSLKRILIQPKEIAMVKMADRICNLFSPPFYWDQERKRIYIDEANLILDQLGWASSHLSMRLQKKISEYPT